MPTRIKTISTYLPGEPLSNEEYIENYLKFKTSPEKIVQNTGIEQRHISPPDETMLEMIENCHAKKPEITAESDVIILSSMSDLTRGKLAECLAGLFGKNKEILQINNNYAGFIFGLAEAQKLIQSGKNQVSLINAEQISQITNWEDEVTAHLAADACTITILSECEAGATGEILGIKTDIKHETKKVIHLDSDKKLFMDSKKITTRIVKNEFEKIKELTNLMQKKPDEIILHQGNLNILKTVHKRLEREGFPKKEIRSIIDKYGDPGSSGIPLLLNDFRKKLNDGIWALATLGGSENKLYTGGALIRSGF